MKRILAILMLTLLLFCGAGGAAVSSFYVDVFDSTNANSPIEGASVTLSGTASTTLYTTSTGTAEFKDVTYPAEYKVTVSKSGYIAQTKTVKIEEANKREPFYLSSETPVLITVTSSDGEPVSGADVTINKKSAGKTDANGRLHAAMIRGAYNTVEVSASSYVTYNKEVFLEKDAAALNVQLAISKVSPLILVYSEDKEPIAGAGVFIDGNLVAYTDSYGKAQLAAYTAGTYGLKVEAANFQTYSGDVTFSGNSASHTITLKYATETITIKAMAGETPVSETVIYFNGDVKGMTNADGVYTTSAAPDTKIYISASHDGYSAESVTYTVKAGADNTVIIDMEQDIPVVLIGIGILSVIIVLLIVVLLVGGKKRGGKSAKSPAKSYPPTNKRDSL